MVQRKIYYWVDCSFHFCLMYETHVVSICYITKLNYISTYHSSTIHHIVQIFMWVSTEIHAACHSRKRSSTGISNPTVWCHVFIMGLMRKIDITSTISKHTTNACVCLWGSFGMVHSAIVNVFPKSCSSSLSYIKTGC